MCGTRATLTGAVLWFFFSLKEPKRTSSEGGRSIGRVPCLTGPREIWGLELTSSTHDEW